MLLMLVTTAFWSFGSMPTLRAADGDNAEMTKLRAEIEQLKGRLPSQSHAMMDVGYHFSNLWFAGQKKNWPLAQFYLEETRSHLRWAVRIISVRKTTSGEVDLRGLLEAVDHAGLAEVGKAIAGRNPSAFETAYKQTLDGCYTCHKAAEKPYLRLRIPDVPETRIIDFDPFPASP
jgi:hypothetical protein